MKYSTVGREGRGFKIKKILLSVFSIEGTCSPKNTERLQKSLKVCTFETLWTYIHAALESIKNFSELKHS